MKQLVSNVALVNSSLAATTELKPTINYSIITPKEIAKLAINTMTKNKNPKPTLAIPFD